MVVTILLTAPTGQGTKFTQTFGTMTSELLQLDAWLEEHQVSHLAFESTGVYTPPLYNLDDLMNEYGAEGWELVGTATMPMRGYVSWYPEVQLRLIFKRQRQEEE